MTNDPTAGRGEPWEYDPGPPRNRSWPRLFAETPNYRGISHGLTGKDEFRWHHGPMFYRGRLGDNKVKVLIVGQEGAQDESLSHRSFTGGTGGRMQHFLHHLGITDSYLFLNTFVYPIFGQYDGILPAVAQSSDSAIAQHRNEIFDYALARNTASLRLIVAVGRAAKESIATLIKRHHGHAAPESLHNADFHVLGADIKTIGVVHPGSARGDGLADVVKDFKRVINKINKWANESPGWLAPDDGAERSGGASYEYEKAPIPFRDFAYGTNWRLGRGSTSGTRRDSQRSIELYGGGGGSGDRRTYSQWAASTIQDPGYSAAPGDLPYEPPKADYREFDRGPEPAMARLLMGGSSGLPWPDFAGLGLKANPAFGTGAIYRGRLDDPAVLIVADQQSQDDLFTCRALSGNPGQHLQAFLRAAGLTESYCIVRTLPVDSLAADPATVAAIVDHPATRALHREIMQKLSPRVVLALGSHAQRVADTESPAGTPVIHMPDFDESDPGGSWAAAMAVLATTGYPKDDVASFAYGGDREQIPRRDLPFGMLRWQGSSGDRAKQGKIKGKFHPNFYKLRMPEWADNLPPAPLTPAEQQSVNKLLGS